MDLFRLHSLIFGRPWAIDYREAMYNTPLLIKVLNDHSLAEAFFRQLGERQPDIGAKTSSFLKQASGNRFVDYPKAFHDKKVKLQPGSTAVIPIMGTLIKYGDLCSYGMNDIIEWINHADVAEEVKDIIFLVDTPGGTVDGTMKLGDRINSLRKPNVALIDGLCCSGGMWVASNADRIVALNNTCEIGSIGVALYFADARKMYEEMGVTFHDINSSLSKDKNKEFFDALEKKYDTVRSESLDPLAKMFINQILKNRPETAETKNEWHTAKVFFAQQAKELKLIDAIGDANLAIGMLNELHLIKPIIHKIKISMKEKYPNILAALGLDEIENESDLGMFMNTSLLDSLEASIKESNEKIAGLGKDVGEKEKAIQEAEKSVADKTTEIITLNSQMVSMSDEIKALKEAQKSDTDKEAELEVSKSELARITGEKEKLEEEVKTLKEENEKLKDEDAAAGGGAHTEGDNFPKIKEDEAASDEEANSIFQTHKKISESRLEK